MKPTYSELLKDPRWQKKRLEVMEDCGWKCEECGSKTETLNVHHGYYEKGKMPWEHENPSLHCLCQKCHDERHYFEWLIQKRMAELSITGLCNLWDDYLSELD